MAKILKQVRASDLQFYKEERYFYLMPAINTALRATTGEKWKSHKDWSAWWKDHKKGFVPLDDTTPLPADDEPWLIAGATPEKAFENRFAWSSAPPLQKLTMDGTPLLQATGEKAEIAVEGDGDARALVVKIDGKEFSRLPLPKLDVKPPDLPPLAFKDVKGISTKVENKTINGKSTAKVWVGGKLVYDGVGGTSVKAVAHDDFVEVTIDGRVVYRAGQLPKNAGSNDK